MLLQVSRISINLTPLWISFNWIIRNFMPTVVDQDMVVESVFGRDDLSHGYELLKELDPVAANRIHPNNHRKVRFMICYFLPCR